MKTARTPSGFIPLLVIFVLPLAACDQFDAELEDMIPVEHREQDAGPEHIHAANFCEPPHAVPVREADDLFVDVGTVDLRNSFSDLSSCGIGRSLWEVDGFFRVQLIAGGRYHFHVKAWPDQDLAIYLLSSCDERTCVASIDECPAGTDEHLSFVPRSAGSYLLGIDGISDGPTDLPVQFLFVQPVCGDGILQHSEVCDDGNLVSGDGCDEVCRAELRDGAEEVEPNGDAHGANVIVPDSNGRATIRGTLGGPCDSDFFLVRVPAYGALHVTMLSESGFACHTAPPTRMRLLDSALDQVFRAEGNGGACPSLDGVASSWLAGGDYYVVLRATESVEPFRYRLGIAVTRVD